MSNEKEIAGKCLCGAISVTAANVDNSLGACHCGTCRKWGGGPYMSVDCGTEVRFEGDENLGIFASSEWAQRGFCKKCGTHLFYKLTGNGQYFMPGALFGEELKLDFDHQVFIDEKPSHYSFANETHDMTGAELFAKYNS